MITCQYCKTENGDDHKFCKECGNRLKTPVAVDDAEHIGDTRPVVDVAAAKNKAFVFITRGQYDDAEAELLKAIKQHPNVADLHYSLGTAYHRLGRFENAINELDRAVSFDPGHFDAFLLLGNIFGDDLRNHYMAIKMYEHAIRLRPNFPDVRNNLGNAYRFTGKLEQARDQFEKAIELNPNYARARFNLGKVLYQLGDYQEAEKQYRGAICVDANHPKAHKNLGRTLMALGRTDEALPHLQNAVQLDPEYAKAYAVLAQAYHALGDAPQAEANAARAAALMPQWGALQDILKMDL
jgi:tetratricopeptide (TPR) repeat protein